MESALVGFCDTDCQVTEANETNFFLYFVKILHSNFLQTRSF